MLIANKTTGTIYIEGDSKIPGEYCSRPLPAGKSMSCYSSLCRIYSDNGASIVETYRDIDGEVCKNITNFGKIRTREVKKLIDGESQISVKEKEKKKKKKKKTK